MSGHALDIEWTIAGHLQYIEWTLIGHQWTFSGQLVDICGDCSDCWTLPEDLVDNRWT